MATWTWQRGSEVGDASQELRPLRLQELEEGACHCGEAEPPHRRLLARGRLCRRLLLPCPLPLMEATRLEARGELRAA